MIHHCSILAWSDDRRECVIFEALGGWMVQMTLGGLSTIEQSCISMHEVLMVAGGWRASYDDSFAIDPKAA